MMKYEEILAKQLSDPWGHLWWDDIYPIRSLNEYAMSFTETQSEEGLLASTIIFHQLTIELVKMILNYDNLLYRASIYPNKTTEKNFIKEDKFRILIRNLSDTIEFQGQKRFIELSRRINDKRNQLSHELIGNYFQFQNLHNELSTKTDFQELFKCWKTAMNWYYDQLKIISERKELKILLNKYTR